MCISFNGYSHEGKKVDNTTILCFRDGELLGKLLGTRDATGFFPRATRRDLHGHDSQRVRVNKVNNGSSRWSKPGSKQECILGTCHSPPSSSTAFSIVHYYPRCSSQKRRVGKAGPFPKNSFFLFFIFSFHRFFSLKFRVHSKLLGCCKLQTQAVV